MTSASVLPYVKLNIPLIGSANSKTLKSQIQHVTSSNNELKERSAVQSTLKLFCPLQALKEPFKIKNQG